MGTYYTISEMNYDTCTIKDCCPADRTGNRCSNKQSCKATWKRYEAIIKPEWHNVSLATLANIDFDMLDEKRQTYLTAFRDLQKTLSYLRKCKTQDTYDTCFIRYIRRKKICCGQKVKYQMQCGNLLKQSYQCKMWKVVCGLPNVRKRQDTMSLEDTIKVE